MHMFQTDQAFANLNIALAYQGFIEIHRDITFFVKVQVGN